MAFFSNMNADYAKKHFPDGSVFEGAAKTVKGKSIAGLLTIGLFFAGALYGLVWMVSTTKEYMADGQDDMLDVSIVLCAFFGLCVLVFGVLICVLIKRMGKKRGHYIALAAKNSKLPVSEIEAFERQAVALDCYILKLTAGLDRAMSDATNKDGLLTRDYIYLADTAQTVMRVDSLKACCFSEYTYSISAGNQRKKIRNLSIGLVASNGVSVLSDTTEKAGQALMELLKERNSAIDTNGGRVLPEGAFDGYKERILEGR